jgi:hypothetical protein
MTLSVRLLIGLMIFITKASPDRLEQGSQPD